MLLDALHEDVNRVMDKPHVPEPDDQGLFVSAGKQCGDCLRRGSGGRRRRWNLESVADRQPQQAFSSRLASSEGGRVVR